MLFFCRGREEGRCPTVLTYEPVQEIDLEFTQPVIILGPLKDQLNNNLMRQFPDQSFNELRIMTGLVNSKLIS